MLDLGCGSGRGALVLAEALRTRVVAVDIHPPFLDQLRATARERGLEYLIEARCADMAALGVPAGSVDLLWSEGAIYFLGFEEGLRLWRPLLAPGGGLAVTECSWLSADPPAEAAAFFCEGYPGIAGVSENIERARAAGFEVLDHFALPPQAWWDEYYRPLEARMDLLAADPDPALAAVIAETRREIELFRRCGASLDPVQARFDGIDLATVPGNVAMERCQIAFDRREPCRHVAQGVLKTALPASKRLRYSRTMLSGLLAMKLI